MKAYPAYKDSRSGWAGQIPETWKMMQLKFLTENHDGKRIPVRAEDRGNMQGEYPYYGANGIIDYVNDYLFDGEYLLVGEDGAPFFLPQDVAFVATGKFWVNNHAHVLKSKNGSDVRFLKYALNSVDYTEYITGSTRDKLTQSDLSRIRLPIPSLLEQQAIADFLDCKTVQIDTFIEKKQREIDLLREQRTALINHAVTKGLNSNTPKKDSGVDWLGEIPSHWETWRLQHLCSTTKGIAFKSDIFTDEGVFVVKATNIKNESIVNVNTFMSGEHAKNYSSVELREGDIILSTVGSKPHIVDSAVGQIARIPAMYDRALLNQNTVRIENKRTDRITTDYLFLALRSHRFKKHLGLHAHGTANQASINLEDILSFFVTLPPIEEQRTTVSNIEKRFKTIGKSVADIQKEINLLNEYRTALISEAVTGKIDVREWRTVHE
jgi:type I restriction enzyme, S subunit